ncbi:MAG: glutamine-hydrolyzing carbamoyl-phosphate synthase small subunit [Candidatus Omnitrophica bacterium]|nr:glutamine-hydrolyzing carbamoyl-phosphate synthase small subunit [Candidatus Omnitrophota bacterium]
MSKSGILVLENGYFWEGESCGASAEGIGQVVFNTAIVGYQEILTDPAYAGKIVVMTYPHIGNYGVSEEGLSSEKVWAKGLIVKEISRTYSNWQGKGSLKRFATENKTLVLAGVDTQQITKHIRTNGTKRGIITTKNTDKETLIEKIKSSPDLLNKNLAKEVSCPRIYQWKDGKRNLPYKIVAIDLGIRKESLQQLSSCGCKITVVPADTKAEVILSLKPDGIFLSSGPGDPAVLEKIVKEIKRLIGKKPLLGIGLGYQILGLAVGAKTFRMKFGHHGLNQSVRNLLTNRCSITAQHHLFALDPASLNKETEVTHINLNDQTLEGIRYKKFPILGIQYHPESNDPIFNEFKQLMQNA